MKKLTSVSDLTLGTNRSKVVPMTHTQTAGQTASTDTYSVSFPYNGDIVTYSNLNLSAVRFIISGRQFKQYDLLMWNNTTWEVLLSSQLRELGAVLV
jgi:hypothetical protein